MNKCFFLFLFFLLSPSSLQSDILCSSYHSCVSCNWQLSCRWSEEKCISLSASKSDSEWASIINSCPSSENIISQSTELCRDLSSTEIPFKINFTTTANAINDNKEEEYKSLLCKWSFLKIDHERSTRLSFTNQLEKNNSQISIILYFKDGKTQIIRTFSYLKFNIIYRELEKIQLYFFSANSLYETDTNIKSRYNQTFIFEGKYSSLNYKQLFFIIFFSAISLIIVTAFILFIYLKLLKKRKSAVSNANRNTELSEFDSIEKNKKALEKILIKTKYIPLQNLEEKCTICCEQFIKDCYVVTLKCNHIFHYDCIAHWAMQKLLRPTCPNCNFDLLKAKIDEKVPQDEIPRVIIMSENNETEVVNVISNIHS